MLKGTRLRVKPISCTATPIVKRPLRGRETEKSGQAIVNLSYVIWIY